MRGIITNSEAQSQETNILHLQRRPQAGGQAEADRGQADCRDAGGVGGAAGHHGGHPQPADRGLLLDPGGLPHREVPV